MVWRLPFKLASTLRIAMKFRQLLNYNVTAIFDTILDSAYTSKP